MDIEALISKEREGGNLFSILCAQKFLRLELLCILYTQLSNVVGKHFANTFCERIPITSGLICMEP